MLDEARLNQLVGQWHEQSRQGRSLSAAELCPNEPELASELERRILGLHETRTPTTSIQASDVPPISALETAVISPAGSIGAAPSTSGSVPPTLEKAAPIVAGDPSLNSDWPTISGYEILGVLGEGGMGAVYKARDVKLNRLVALKVIREGMATKEPRARFQIEAEAVAKLHHPHIVQIFAIGEWQPAEGGPPLPYLALEFVEGGTLEHRAGDSPLEPREAARIVMLLARAMQHAHSRGIIHRDLKPANVLLAPPADEPALNTALGCPRISDFGLARQSQSKQKLTHTGAVMGTPAYMAPEQADGMPVGPPADIYALGAILYRLLTGQALFTGRSAVEILIRVCQQPPVPPREICPQVPGELEAICLRCLAKDPSARYPDAAALAADLEHFLQGHQSEAARATPPKQGTQLVRRRWILGVVGVALVLGALSPWLLKGSHSSPMPVQPLRLAPLQVVHYAVEHDRRAAAPSTLIGKDSFSVRFGDGVVVRVELAEPLHYYLLAFNADGKEQLLWPCDENNGPNFQAPPPREEGLHAHPLAGKWLYLNDEPAGGLQVFVMAASRRPLPPYEDWLKQRSSMPWSRRPAGKRVWQADEKGVQEMLQGVGANRADPGQGIDVPPLMELCQTLKSAGVEAVEAIAFPVEARKK